MLRNCLAASLAFTVFAGCGEPNIAPAPTTPTVAAIGPTETAQTPAIQRLTVTRQAAKQPAASAPTTVQRTTIHNVTMESIDLPRCEWDVAIPSQGTFTAFAGLDGDKLPGGASAQFAMFVEKKGAPPMVLVQTVITSADEGWVELNADLGDFAGQQLKLVLSSKVDPAHPGVRAVWGNPTIQSRAPREGVPVILISCDTTRADHLGCYGYARDTTPNIDNFAREAVLFENAITPETWTLTAHLSMLTGLLPKHHRVARDTNLAEEIVTLPEVLRDNGYTTAGYTGYGIWMQPTRGFSHGFDRYSTPPITRDFFRTLTLVEPWVEAHANAPFFLFLHNYDHHSKYLESDCEGCDMPYFPSRPEYRKFSKELQEPQTLRAEGRPRATDLLFAALNGKQTLAPEEIAYMIALYDDSLRAVDGGVGQFLAKLKSLGIYDKALIIVTADHGECFGEHGQFLHEHIYEGSARAPLLIRFPNAEHGGARVKEMVQLIDLVPTILDYLKIDSPPMDGESLLPIVRGEKEPRDVAFVQRLKHAAIRTNEWKLIRNTETKAEELYRIVDDPAETKDILATNPPELATLRAKLDTFLSETPQTPIGSAAQPMTPEQIEALRNMGYAADIE